MQYFILHNGSDTSDCEGSIGSACASLQQVLSLYYAQPPTKGLQIVTEMSLILDHKVVLSRFTIVWRTYTQKNIWCEAFVHYCF